MVFRFGSYLFTSFCFRARSVYVLPLLGENNIKSECKFDLKGWKLRFSIIMGLLLIGLGFYGALYFHPFFFGFTTVGLFMLIKRFPSQKVSTHAQQPSTVQSGISSADKSFCPRCGTQIVSRMNNCPQCGEKLRES